MTQANTVEFMRRELEQVEFAPYFDRREAIEILNPQIDALAAEFQRLNIPFFLWIGEVQDERGIQATMRSQGSIAHFDPMIVNVLRSQGIAEPEVGALLLRAIDQILAVYFGAYPERDPFNENFAAEGNANHD